MEKMEWGKKNGICEKGEDKNKVPKEEEDA